MNTNIFFILLTFFLGTLSLSAQVPVIKDGKTGKPIKFLRESELRQGKKPAEILSAAAPAGSGAAQVVKSETFPVVGGKRTVTLYRNGTNQALPPKNRKVSTELTCFTEERELSLNDQTAQLMNPITEVLYPGSIIIGTSVPSGAYTPVTVKKNPIAIYVDGLNLQDPQKNSIEVQNPNAATLKSAILQLVNQPLAGPQPANLTESMTEIKSKEDINVVLNAHYNGFGVDVNNTFKFEQSTSSYTVMMEFTEVYYNVAVVVPESSADFFAAPTTIQNDWTYVSSVNYGRRAVLSITVYDKERVISDEFKASMNGFLGSGGISGSVEVKNVFKQATVKGFFIGGNPDGAAKVIQGSPEQALKEFFELKKSGATFSTNSPAVPLSYTLRFVKDNSVAMVGQALKYTQRFCDDVVRFQVTLNDLKCNQAYDQEEVNNAEEIYGHAESSLMNGKLSDAPIKAMRGENDKIWVQLRANDISLKTGKVYPINSTRLYEINIKTFSKAYFKLNGDLEEKDVDKWDTDDDDKLQGAGTVPEAKILISQVKPNVPFKGKLRFLSGDSGSKKSDLQLNYTIEMVKRD